MATVANISNMAIAVNVATAVADCAAHKRPGPDLPARAAMDDRWIV